MKIKGNNLLIEIKAEENSVIDLGLEADKRVNEGVIIGLGEIQDSDYQIEKEVVFLPHEATEVKNTNWVIIPESAIIAIRG